ncbi:single-stranded DNA-binding protein [Embleya hyalina]|uniref:Single-stranded DNA-binding protein n=1 Tax=Embleya hyalina TaxID=516124 RepID=A0A401Z202_9ACTN|nr:single-stranded DNA-binding protein [Embleya hyalina]GCE00919.1 single-stranded DNA-binding protein 1 [Embleya hyalina]
MDTYVTVVGNAASEVRVQMTQAGVPLARFRMAVSPRRFDRDSGQWVSGDASFYTIVCFRGLAENVTSSIDKGDPLVVTGRLRVREWEREGRWLTVTEIDASSVGHDLARGVAEFRRVARPARLALVAADVAAGATVDQGVLAIGTGSSPEREEEAA